MDKRIKLAKAMGYEHKSFLSGMAWYRSDGYTQVQPPDPFTDANDDYACLQFAREKGNPLWTPFMHHCEGEQHQYKIGNWAEALLVAIEVSGHE